ncbi:hypothetical protein [Acuticoccus sp. I52.16.1]|uniref:hypothetical protein n=1 Tax=Acuticoccus sp. I52.16.1 TaxID=2928472 RepID=UPI001FD592A3|nr:hypothetical protein [Acuticoccus sp. I52.16.1]UOM36502.1 hypothetical protein MRB58_10070 [Acuticoccus sp. I52.16.1]
MVDRMERVVLVGETVTGVEHLFTPGSLEFLSRLHRATQQPRAVALAARKRRRGQIPGLRDGDWTAAPIPETLADRRVELVVPPHRRTLAAAVASRAASVVVDFEDAILPTWANIVAGHLALVDTVGQMLADDAPAAPTDEILGPTPVRFPALMIRPRALDRTEAHVLVDGEAIAAAVLDLGLALYHNAPHLAAAGRGLCVTLPELESADEAAVFDALLALAEEALALPQGSIKVTAQIETVPAAYAADEIVHALRERIVALACGRSNYLASAIAECAADPGFVLPDPDALVGGRAMLRRLSQHVVRLAHRRGILALAAPVVRLPTSADAAVAADALEKIRADIERAAADGHDGTQVAHPILVAPALEVFGWMMPQPNQLPHKGAPVVPAALLEPYTGRRTEAGLRRLLHIALGLAAAGRRGYGAAEIGDTICDTATGEWAHRHVRQWLRHGVTLDDGRSVTASLVAETLAAEAGRMRHVLGEAAWADGRFDDALAAVDVALLGEREAA